MATPRRRRIIVDVVTDAHSNVQSIRKDIQEAFASSNMWIMGALPHPALRSESENTPRARGDRRNEEPNNQEVPFEHINHKEPSNY